MSPRGFHRGAGSPDTPDAFRDVGRRIDVLDWQSEESTLAALELSAAKWGAFVVTGNEEFKARCACLAAKHGFEITNPELQGSIARERERLRAAVEPTPEPEVVPEATPGPIPTTEEPPPPPRAVEPEIAKIAVAYGDAHERGLTPKWNLAVPESWDRDLDRPREHLLLGHDDKILYRGHHSVRSIARGVLYHHFGDATDQDDSVLKGAVESLDAARERARGIEP